MVRSAVQPGRRLATREARLSGCLRPCEGLAPAVATCRIVELSWVARACDRHHRLSDDASASHHHQSRNPLRSLISVCGIAEVAEQLRVGVEFVPVKLVCKPKVVLPPAAIALL
jgi:hypothetical protein